MLTYKIEEAMSKKTKKIKVNFKERKNKYIFIRSDQQLIDDIAVVAKKENTTKSEALRGLVQLGLAYYNDSN